MPRNKQVKNTFNEDYELEYTAPDDFDVQLLVSEHTESYQFNEEKE